MLRIDAAEPNIWSISVSIFLAVGSREKQYEDSTELHETTSHMLPCQVIRRCGWVL